MVVGGRFLLRGPLQMAATRHRFDALVRTNDHRAVAEAALAAIRTYTNAEFLHDRVTSLAPAIAVLRPNYVVVYPDAVTIEFAGGFDHFGFKVEDKHDIWEMSWYTEKGHHPLLTLAKQEGGGEHLGRSAPVPGRSNVGKQQGYAFPTCGVSRSLLRSSEREPSSCSLDTARELSNKSSAGARRERTERALIGRLKTTYHEGGWCPRASRDSDTHFRGCAKPTNRRIVRPRAADYERLTHKRTGEMAAWKN